MSKVSNLRITRDFLDKRANDAIQKGYPKAKWIEFCEEMLSSGYDVFLYEARKTFSKYITIHHGKQRYKVRFSNHRPIPARELKGDCDFFVGVTNLTVTRTHDAIAAVHRWKNNLCAIQSGRVNVSQENQSVRSR